MTLLSVENLSVIFETEQGIARAVDGINLFIEESETVGLVGESGCGKTVTGLSILRLIPNPPGRIEGGKIIFKDENLLNIPTQKFSHYRGKKIGMIFQDPTVSLNPVLSIKEHLVETVKLHKKVSGQSAINESVRLLEEAGISDTQKKLNSYPFQLSGGEKQRVMIALSLAGEPELLIADEPTTSLDVTIQAQILNSIDRIQKARGMAMLLITHDLGVISKRTKRSYVMYAGKIVEEAPTKELLSNPNHPYTKALINALPSRKRRGKKLENISGAVPAPIDFPKGCRFNPRCPIAIEKCKIEEPSLIEITSNHKTACHLCGSRNE